MKAKRKIKQDKSHRLCICLTIDEVIKLENLLFEGKYKNMSEIVRDAINKLEV